MSGPHKPRRGKGNAAGSGREIYLEFFPVGNSVKVVAIDSVTGLEVTIVGPVNAARRALEQNAIRKLNYMLAKSEDS